MDEKADYVIKVRRKEGLYAGKVMESVMPGESVRELLGKGDYDILDLRLFQPVAPVEDLGPLIDLALATGDREWFMELTERQKAAAR